MKNAEIHIRDPFVLTEGGQYYMYGTRGGNFGQKTGGFDVYTGTDLQTWSEPKPIFESAEYGLDRDVHWAPELHKYGGRYYLFATFTQANGRRATYSLVSDTPDGKFAPVSGKPLTPEEWWSLDGTLFIDDDGAPWLVFCHEHVQVLNGTVCAVRLTPDLGAPAGEPILLFYGSDAYGAPANDEGRYVTDGPFLHRGENGRLYMMWSTGINGQYCQCLAVSEGGGVTGPWRQLEPMFTADGGHGMLFRALDGQLMLTLHRPNNQPDERPQFFAVTDDGSALRVVQD